MKLLSFTSCMAPNMDKACAAIATYIGKNLNIPTLFVDDVAWQVREQHFD